jgi:hypothetical protein
MITVRPDQTNPLSLHASVNGFAIYLDLFAMKELAKGEPARRKRFIGALDRGAEVLFSVANAAELSGPQGVSFREIRGFVDEIGPRWFPVELAPHLAVKRESEGKAASECCFCGDFLKDYMRFRLADHPAAQVVALSGEFFRLGPIMDWLAPQRDSIAAGKDEMDKALIEQIKEHRAKFESDPGWLETAFPSLQPFKPAFPAIFAYVNLVRMLILETKGFALKRGDGMDFCQAVIGSAFASVATLDKHWKRRVESLPQPNGLAKVYCSPYLDAMVDEIERNLDLLERSSRPAAL